MPRGVYERGAKAEGSAMSKDELQEAEQRLEGKVSPLPAPTGAKIETVQSPDGHTRHRVGNFMQPAKVGDSGTIKHFAHTPADREGWIEMSSEESSEYEKKRVLIGYDSEEGIGLIKKTPSPAPIKRR